MGLNKNLHLQIEARHSLVKKQWIARSRLGLSYCHIQKSSGTPGLVFEVGRHFCVASAVMQALHQTVVVKKEPHHWLCEQRY